MNNNYHPQISSPFHEVIKSLLPKIIMVLPLLVSGGGDLVQFSDTFEINLDIMINLWKSNNRYDELDKNKNPKFRNK